MIAIRERISLLRKWMEANDVFAYIIPGSDPHQSEYVADHWKMREWISGFSGSSGTVVITMNHAGLWTDSRYFIQAREELQEGGLVLHKQVNQGEPEHIVWLSEELSSGQRVGIDSFLFSANEIQAIEHIFAGNKIELVTGLDAFSSIWSDRPALPSSQIFNLDATICGASRREKIKNVAAALENKGCSHMLVTALDEIAWLLNLRGRDVDCNPVFIAYAVIELEQVLLFVAPEKINDSLRATLEIDGVIVEPYLHVLEYLNKLDKDITILVDPNKTSLALCQAIGTSNILEATSPLTLMKAIKNPVEQENLRKVMIKDGVALVKAYRWLEKSLNEGDEVTEATMADQIAQFRSEEDGYFGESFNAIIGYRGNGAIIHYRPEHGKSSVIQKDGMLLVDSGGQYTDGTTDITRTTHLGIPTEEEKLYYTLVLKGHIALAKVRFPEGTTGIQLDILARQFLWEYLANYGHGTGHGVGFFMNVHEPPQGFVTRWNERGATAHAPGMYTSNEPGFYKENEFGIRVENLIICQEAGNSDHGTFLEFETITLFPIDTDLINRSLLTDAERHWLNDYHGKVNRMLSPALNQEEREWLQGKCKPI